MNDKADSSLSRMLSVLDLFSDQRLQWSAEDISEALQVSLPTGYRYVRMLTESGLLQHSADSQYTLGPRIIVLDHYIRQADPVLQHGIPFMKELVAQTGLDCVVSALLGQQLLDTHRELGQAPANLSYGRGRPRPLFKGGAPKVILAALAKGRTSANAMQILTRWLMRVCPLSGQTFVVTTARFARPVITCQSVSLKPIWPRWQRLCTMPTAPSPAPSRWLHRFSAWGLSTWTSWLNSSCAPPKTSAPACPEFPTII